MQFSSIGLLVGYLTERDEERKVRILQRLYNKENNVEELVMIAVSYMQSVYPEDHFNNKVALANLKQFRKTNKSRSRENKQPQ